jgi:dTDP-4-amino-4,6-dideoxygalactose transaminase
LHLAALSLGLGEGDAVVVPSLTFLATANAARYVGAEVIFADVDPFTGLLTAEALEAAIARAGRGQKVRAAFPVHMNGQCADMAALSAVAERHGLEIVEDACHALGAKTVIGNELVPTGACRHSAIAAFSLHPVKAIAMGEGGMLTTNDDDHAASLRRLRNHGMTRDPAAFTQAGEAHAPDGKINPWYYEMPEVGFNYRASELNSALGLSQLKKIDVFLARRRAIAAFYDKAFADLGPVLLARMPGCESGWHLYVVLIDFEAAGQSRETVMRRLLEKGIGTQVHYLPVHRQPYYRARYGELSLPGADAYYAHCLSLPIFPSMSDEDAASVVAGLRQVLGA